MNPQTALAVLLTLAVLIASIRLLLWQRAAGERARPWRLALLLLAQPLCAALLYFTLLPPTTPGQAGTLVVLTADAKSLPPLSAADVLVALPEAPAFAGAERAPDLATALRRHPGTQRLHVLGAGLEARDREAARVLSLRFAAPPLPPGLVRLDRPARIAPGTAFTVGGRVQGNAGGSVELRDPTGQRVDTFALADSGEFVLSATARTPGLADFQLRILDPQRKLLEEARVPLSVTADPAPRVLVLAGAPNPELKYLRRWMADAGIKAHTQISVGGGMQLGDAPLALNAATFERFDLLVVDDRAWAALGEGQRGALIEALRGGLGVLLRITGPLPDATRRQLRGLGFAVSGGGDSAEVRLADPERDDASLRARRGAGSKDAPIDADASTLPVLNRRALRIEADDAASGLRDAAGATLSEWRAEGRGRIGLWTLTDSYRLVLEGRDDRYAEMWSEVFASLSRARDAQAPRIQHDAWAQQRMSVCGAGEQAVVIAPDAKQTRLLPDPASGSPPCAAFWPTQGGWHLLKQGEASWPFHVHDSKELPTMRVAALGQATLHLVAERNPPTASAAKPDSRHRGASWPWFLAWLCASAGLWWLERSRLGRRPAPVTAGIGN